MKCTNCGYDNAAGAGYCNYCNNALSDAPSSPASTSPAAPAQTATPAPSAAPSPSAVSSYTPASAPSPAGNTAAYSYPQPYASQPYYSQPFAVKAKQPFTITDVYIIIGFVLAIVGIFTYAFILLPASIGFSIVGFIKRNNARTLGLSIAGIVVGVVACLIKVGMALEDLGVIPDWLSAGIF